MPDWIDRWMESLQVLSWWEVLLYGALAAVLTQLVLVRLVHLFTRKTLTNVDDQAIAAVRWPIFWSVIFVAVYLMLRRFEPALVLGGDPGGRASIAERVTYWRWLFRAVSVIQSVAIIMWARALMRLSDTILELLARRADDFRWIEPRSLPLYEIGSKLVLFLGSIYALMLAWDIDVTAWLASAGILGIALGFAAKDTLANLFAGIFILTDAPYKLGDYIVIESGERGRVTDIGIRSTRILTRDDIEITLPNSIMANSKVVNETSGPHVKRRLRIDIGIAYGSDVAKARKVMEDAISACDLIAHEPAPSVRFRAFGESALAFQVRGYIEQPVLHGRAVDQACTHLYEALLAAEVEIPFPQRVVTMKSS